MSTSITDHLWAPAGGWEQQDSACIFCKEPKARHTRHLPAPTARDKLMPIMFWGNAFEVPEADRGSALLVGALFGLFTGRLPNIDPKNYVRVDIPRARRELAAGLLASGKVIESYFGDATCRICGAVLGNKDLGGWGHLWPEKADHYVLEHDVWVPGLDRLIERSGN
jgi:hypothetical protein